MPSQQAIRKILLELKKRFLNPGGMEIGSPYQNLVGVLLSARSRDEQVLARLPDFFDRFPSVNELATASRKEIESYIDTIGMFRQKSKHT